MLYLPSLGHGFVRDDVPLIVENATLRGTGGLGHLLASDFLASLGFTSGFWRPLVLLSFWVDGRLGGWTPVFFHAVNLLLHVGVTLVLGLLLGQAGLPRAAMIAGAAWFATMPAHVESVSWIAGRTDLLCAAGALLSLCLDRRARQAGRVWPGPGALGAFACALLAKEVAAGWMVVVLAAELARARRSPTTAGEMVRWLAPYLAITLAWLWAHSWAAGPTALPGYVDEALRARRQSAAWVMLPQYTTFLWPWYPHASDVPAWLPPPFPSWQVLAGAAFSLMAIGSAFLLAARRSQGAVPCAVILIPLLPVMAISLSRGFVASGERMMYLPSAGLAWLGALALAETRRLRPAGRWLFGASTVLLIAGSGIETLRLQPQWADDAHVFSAMTERHPENPVGWIGMAEVLEHDGRRAEAEQALVRAESLDPRLPAVHLALAELHYRNGEWGRAIIDAGRAIALDDGLVRARELRASALVRVRRGDEAARDIERLLHDRPGHPETLLLLGQLRLSEGRPADAVAPLSDAARARPNDPGLWFAIGAARAAIGDLAEARAALERTVALEPRSAAGWRELARLCAAQGDSLAAAAARERGRALADPLRPAPP